MSFIEKTQVFLPGLINKAAARKPPSSQLERPVPAKENKRINILGTYRKQFCRTPAVNGHWSLHSKPRWGLCTARTKHSGPWLPSGSSLPLPKGRRWPHSCQAHESTEQAL